MLFEVPIGIGIGTEVRTLCGSPRIHGYKDGKGLEAQFMYPMYLVCDSQGNLYVTEYGAHRIRKVTAEGIV